MKTSLKQYERAAALLRRWEDEVRHFAPDEHLRWQSLLRQLPDTLSPEQLRDALSPIVAKNDKEQALFRTIFEQVMAEMGEEPPIPPPPTPSFWAKYRRILLLLLIPIAAVVAWYLYTPQLIVVNQTPIRVYLTLPAGSEKNACPDSVALTPRGQIIGAQFEYPEAAKIDGDTTLNIPLGVLSLSPEGCVILAAKPDTAGRDSIRYWLVARNVYAQNGQVDIRALDVLIDVVKINNGVPIVEEKGTKPPQQLTTHRAPYDHDPLVRAMAFEPSSDLSRWAGWIKAAALLLTAVLLFLFLRWRALKRRKLVAQRDESARPPYVWNIRIPGLAPPDPGDNFSATLNALRRRADDEIRTIDLPATVRATVRRGGMAALQYRRQTRMPEYLLLVDRHDPRDHRARLYDDLFRVLRQNEVQAERFFFENDVKLCYNEEFPDGLGIEDLLFRYPNHRLLIIGEGRSLFSATTGRLAKWTELLGRWKDRALLSPLPAAQWGRRERSLAQLFRFAPATIPGLRSLVEMFEAEDFEQRAPELDKLAALAAPADIRLEGNLLQTLEQQIPDPLTRTWLAACALWPELHYDLSCWLGAWLEQESGETVASFQRLHELLRLPWFADGVMPDPARAALIDWLRSAQPGLEEKLRGALHALLRENAPPPDSAAWDDFALRVAFNEWLITSDPKTKKELADKIARWLDTTGRSDFIMVRALRGKPGPLDSLLPDNWKKSLFKGGIPAIGLRDVWKDALRIGLPILIGLGAALVFWNPETPVCKGVEADIRLDSGDTVHCCVETGVQNVLLLEYNYREAAGRKDTFKINVMKRAADSNNDWPKGLSPDTSKTVSESRTNIANAMYNAGIPFYRVADSLRRVQPGYRPDTSLARQRACGWFERAADWDSTLSWVRAANAWCAAPDKPIDIAGSGSGGGTVIVPGLRRNYALLFAVNNYKNGNAPNLRYPIEQTTALANELKSEYGFETRVIQNPTKAQIINALSEYRNKKYTPKDQLLVFFSGSGYFENGGYLAPSDGDTKPGTANNIKYTDFQDQVNAIPCPGILLALDAPMGDVSQKGSAAISTIDKPARLLIAAGFRERIPDKSPFADRFLETLKNLPQAETMNTAGLFDNLRSLKPAVFYSVFGNHAPGADFYFVKASATGRNASIPLPDLIAIPGGSYRRGCTDEKDPDCGEEEKPVREVKINAFLMGRTEITVAQYMAFANETKSHVPEWLEPGSKYNIKTGTNDLYKSLGDALQAPDNPIVGVSCEDASAYCKWLSAKTGRTYRLPTEAEWEYAARGGQKGNGYKFAGSDNIDDVAWYSANSGDKTHPVARKKGNELGLFDMSGNVWEWCADWYDSGYYADGPVDNPQGPATGSDRVYRGGSLLRSPRLCRVSIRINTGPGGRFNDLGFRVAVSSQ